jgi:hypothetical protein
MVNRINNGPNGKQARSDEDTERKRAVFACFEHKKTSGQAAQDEEIVRHLKLDNGQGHKGEGRTDDDREQIFHIQRGNIAFPFGRQKYIFARKMDKIAEKKEKDKAKRQQARHAKMQAGTQELALWLRDLVRQGLAALPERPKTYFNAMAQRLVDAQCSALAATVRALRDLEYRTGDHWQERATDLVARLWTVAQAFERLHELPQEYQADIRTMAGWGPGPKDVLADPEATAVQDLWLVAGRTTEMVEDITTQRNWLFGLRTGQRALVLNYAYKNMPIETSLVPGQAFEGAIAYFPSASLLRAVVRHEAPHLPAPAPEVSPLPNWAAAEQYMAEVLGQLPLVEQFVVYVQGMVPLYHDGRPALADSDNFVLHLAAMTDELAFPRLLALSGGHPLDVLVVLDRGAAVVLGGFYGGQYVLV